MKAAVFYEAEDIRIEDVPEPELGPEDVLVDIDAVGICGSDIEYYYGRSPVGTATGKGPLVLGHEFMGRVSALGSAVPDGALEIGDRVAVNPIQSCYRCDACRAGRPQFCTNLSVLGVTTNGGFAGKARTHVSHAYRLPDSISDDEGAFVEMLAAAVNAIDKAAIDPGDLVLISGPGPVGLAMVQLAKGKGASVVLAGTRDDRLAVGARLGADLTVNVGGGASLAEAIEAEYGQLADRVIVATSSLAANEEAFQLCAPGATIVFMAVTGPDDTVAVPMLDSLIADRTIRFSLWYPNQWPRTIKLLEQKIVDTGPIITTHASLDDLSGAIGRQVAREDGAIKTIVNV
jgi:L-iditol 2-dehydrogenase